MLSDFIEKNAVKAKLVTFKKEVKTVSQMSQQSKYPVEEIVKSMVYMAGEQVILVLLLGHQRASEIKIKQALEGQKIRMASEKEVLESTGFEVGGIPPFGIYGVKTLIQREIESRKLVMAGGGDDLSGLEISGAELVKFAFDPILGDFKE